jgi:hypothetical protein
MSKTNNNRLRREIEGLRKAIAILDDRCVQLIEVVNLQDKTIGVMGENQELIERELEKRSRQLAEARLRNALRTEGLPDHSEGGSPS